MLEIYTIHVSVRYEIIFYKMGLIERNVPEGNKIWVPEKLGAH